MHFPTVPVALSCLLLEVLPAQQDMLGVTFDGLAIAFDSHTGIGGSMGPTSPFLTGHNAMARLGNDLWTTDRTPLGAGFNYHLDRIDRVTGNGVRSASNVGDLRGLAAHPSLANTLCGVIQAAVDQFATITISGTVTTIGATGFTGIQALTGHGSLLYAWDQVAGLLRVDPATGVATDVNPTVGTNGAAIQFLMSHTDGRLLGGNRDLYLVDPSTGTATLLAPLAGGAFDIRGAEERLAFRQIFGLGCATASALHYAVNVSGALLPGSLLNASSPGHTPGGLGVFVLGFSNQQAQGQALPFLLDPMFGTNNCRLYTSIDVTFVSVVTLQGNCNSQLTLPAAAAGVTLFAQQAVLEATLPGGMTWSHGVMIKVGV